MDTSLLLFLCLFAFSSGIQASISLDCTFRENNCSFTNLGKDDFDWTLLSGRYVYMSTAHHRKPFEFARLAIPSQILSKEACFSFYYHMYGAEIGSLKVYTNNTLVWQLDGNQGNQWIKGQFFMKGGQIVTIIFEGIVGTGGAGFIAIDDILMKQHPGITEKNCLFTSSYARPRPPTPSPPPSSPAPPNIRLIGGRGAFEGRVEIIINGVWGTVCDDLWNIWHANVVCRVLGFPVADDAPCCGKFGSGEGDILLDQVRCTGDEGSLLDCQHDPVGVHDCTHSEDAGVVCLLTTPSPTTSSLDTTQPLNTSYSTQAVTPSSDSTTPTQD